MNHGVKNLGIAFLTAIYFVAVFSYTKPNENAGFETYQHPGQEQYLATFSNSLYCHTTPTENQVNYFNSFPSSNLKDQFDKQWAFNEPIEQLIRKAFTQYFNFSINFLIQYRKSAITYPFHYFW